MATFQFRLGALLTLRQRERDTAQTSVAEANQAIGILEDQIAEKNNEIAALKQQSQSKLQGRISVNDLMSIGRFEMQLLQDCSDLRSQVKQIEAELEKRQELLLVADQEVRRIEKLKEHARRAYQEQEQTRMQDEMNEYAAIVHRAGKANELEL